MSQSLVLKCKGLFTYPNNLSAVPDGALVEADNVYIDRTDVAQTRRGFKVFTQTALITLAKSLHNYQSRIVLHQSDNLQYETDPVAQPGVFTIYQESINGVLVDAVVEAPNPSSGLKIKSTEMNRNFYFTSEKGIMKIDNVTNSLLRSGVPQALDFDLELVDQAGFLLQESVVAYQVIWGYKDANNNLVVGAPSQREVIYYYGTSQFIDDINALLTEIASQGSFSETYPSALTSTATLSIIYNTLKQIVKSLNLEPLLTYKQYEAGGTIQISSVTTRPKSAMTGATYFIFEDNNGRFVPWMNVSGTNTQPNPSLKADLRLTDTFIEVDFDTAFTRAVLTNQGVTYTAVNSGTSGNSITITLVNPGIDGPLSISVIGNSITVTLARAGILTTTATQLVAALIANAPASALVTASGAGGTLIILSSTPLATGTGDDNDAAVVATLVQTSITASVAEVTQELTTNNLTIRTLFDQDVESTVDGASPTGFTFATVESGSALSLEQLTLITLQEAFDVIVNNLNDNGVPVDPDFIEATTSKAVSLYITIPSDIINLSESGTTFFYQIYRTALFDLVEGLVTVPDEELQLVYENNPTTAEITAGFVGPVIDETTNTFRAQGQVLYTSPSQEGILASNFQPPYAKDITLYKQQVFAANTRSKYTLNLALLTGQESNGSTPGFTTSSQALLVNQGVTYTAVQYGTVGNSITITIVNPALSNHPLTFGVVGSNITITLATDGASVITTTAAQLITALNLNVAVSAVVSASGSGAVPLVALAQTSLATGTTGTVLTFDQVSSFFEIVFVPDTGIDDFENGVVALIDPTSGTLDPSDDVSAGQILEQMAQKITKAVNRHVDNAFLNAYYVSGFNDLPGNIQFETRFLENPIFTIEGNLAIIRNAFSPSLESANAVATNELAINQVRYSKFQQPEAWPIVNFFNIGAGDKGIIRIIPSRDSLFVFKEDGLFVISGQEGQTLQVNGLDNTCRIKGPETAAIGNNQIYVFTDDGISVVTEAGPQNISLPIEDKVLALPNTALYTGLDRASFGVFYDTEKKYYLWLPTLPTDQVATQCLVWNTSTDTWTRLPISKTCGLVNNRDNKLYLGAGDVFSVEQERKNFNIYDYADREFQNQILSVTYDELTDALTLKLQNLSNIEIGDVIQQVEYVTPYYFNRILTQLDLNQNTESDYYAELKVVNRSEILTNLNLLANKLDTDLGVADTDYRANIDAIAGITPVIVFEKFNLLVEQMNTDTGIDESTFPTIDQTYTFYSHIASINSLNNTVTMQDDFPFQVGTMTTFQAIDTLITWSPNSAENPAIWKHFREANMLFSEAVLRQFQIGFASDVARNFQLTTVNDDSLAGWGITSWAVDPWGSDPEPRAYRPFIPREKQRSRYLNAQFKHSRAFEYYLLNGLSISYDNLTSRVTR